MITDPFLATVITAGTIAVSGWMVHTALTRKRRKPMKGPEWRYVGCPLADTKEQALAWFWARKAKDVKLWAGPDGLIRGTGKVPW